MNLHFGGKYIIFVLAKRRKPVNKGFSPLFLCENGQKSGCSTKHLENFIGRSEKFLSESGFSLGEVGARIDDIEPSKGNYSGQYYPLAHAQLLPSISTRVQKCELKRL